MAVLLAVVIGLMVLLIGIGLFDPRPVGDMRWQKSDIALSVQRRGVLWLNEGLAEQFTVRGTAVYQSGEQDSVYGLALGSAAEYLAVGVSPLGYVTVWQGETVLMPLQPWPHVRTGPASNEFWLDVRGDEITVWLNREILWVGKAAVAGDVGVVAESWGETVEFQFIEITFFAP